MSWSQDIRGELRSILLRVPSLPAVAWEGRDFVPVHPLVGTPWLVDGTTPLSFTMLGRWAGICQTKSDEISARVDSRPAGAPPQSPEEVAADNAEYLAVAVRRWTLTHLDGQPYPYTAENARKLFMDPRFAWLRPLLLGFHRNDGNFLAKPTAPSSNGPDAPSP